MEAYGACEQTIDNLAVTVPSVGCNEQIKLWTGATVRRDEGGH